VAGGLGIQSVGSPALLSARALRPLLGMRSPALVKSPIFIKSRLLRRAAIISCLFFAAFSLSFSFDLFLFEIYDIRFLLSILAKFLRVFLLRKLLRVRPCR
jgi:hypothetical protein